MPQAERSSYAHHLYAAEDGARSARKNLWEDYQEPQGNGEGEDEEDEEDQEPVDKEEKKDGETTSSSPPERKTDYTKVCYFLFHGSYNSCTWRDDSMWMSEW